MPLRVAGGLIQVPALFAIFPVAAAAITAGDEQVVLHSRHHDGDPALWLVGTNPVAKRSFPLRVSRASARWQALKRLRMLDPAILASLAIGRCLLVMAIVYAYAAETSDDDRRDAY